MADEEKKKGLPVKAGEEEGTQTAPAPFLGRVTAGFIDLSLVAGAVFVFWIAVLGLSGLPRRAYIEGMLYSGAFKFAAAASTVMLILLLLAVGWLYHMLMEISRFQGTLGKIALKIKVTKTSGRPLDVRTATIRFACKAAAFVCYPVLLLGIAICFFGGRGQMFHDVVSKTMVTGSQRSEIDGLL